MYITNTTDTLGQGESIFASFLYIVTKHFLTTPLLAYSTTLGVWVYAL